MNYAALAWADKLPITGAARSVLTALITFTNSAGVCWPSVKSLAVRAGVDERSVRREIGELVALGLIDVDRSRGRQTSRYTLRMSRQDEGLQSDHATPSGGCQCGRQKPDQTEDVTSANPDTGTGFEAPTLTLSPGSPAPGELFDAPTRTLSPPTRTLSPPNYQEQQEREEVSIPPRNSRRRESGGEWETAFVDFYRAYPRKQGRLDAAKAFRACLRAGTTAAEIMAGLARHRFSGDPRWIPYPGKWLRHGQWADEPVAAKADPFAWVESWLNPQASEFSGETIDVQAFELEAVR